MEGNISDIRCMACQAPARYDVVRGEYRCAYCGSHVGIREAQAQRQGFRQLQQAKIKRSAESRHLIQASCSGCGAALVFEEGEAIASCAFCGRALIRKDYLASKEMPEMIIPFRITEAEARGCLLDWCGRNSRRREAGHLKEKAEGLKGFYLPYELIRGPVSCKVSRMDCQRSYQCSGYIDNVFVNASKQLDNLLLDGMEPYELSELREFDFAYAAGQRVKIRDVPAAELGKRVQDEVSGDYTPIVRKTLESKAVTVLTDAKEVLRMPVLLPVYYLSEGNVVAAVNGQTGKVSVRAEKESHYYFVPWWLKAILATLLVCGAVFMTLCFFGMAQAESLQLALMLGAVILVVSFAIYSDTVQNGFRVESGRRIFTTYGGALRRVGGRLVRDAKELRKEVVPPAFFEVLGGRRQHVKLAFSSPLRTLRTILLSLSITFLPVIIALFLNGFDFGRLELGGSAVWFCITAVLVPVFILKGITAQYENPWIYIISENGSKKRYHAKPWKEDAKETLELIMLLLFSPPVCFASWIVLLIFGFICSFTAFGFD